MIESKIPKIRFKGYKDNWEQRKLGDVAPLRGGYAFQSTDFEADGIPIVKISNILSNGEVAGEFNYYKELEKDEDFLLPDKAAVLAMSGATTGKVAILSNPDNSKVYQNQRVGYFRHSNECDYTFLSTLVRSHLFIGQLSSVLAAGAQPNVSSKDIDGFEFGFPKSIDEQAKIGEYFSSIDNLITLHQRKCEETKTLKKYMLQKMFPKDGESVPEIRFAGFTDAWEQRKLGEVTERVQGNDGRMDLPTLTISAANGWLDQRDRFSSNIAGSEQKNYTLLHKGELSYNHGNSKLAKYGTVFTLRTYEEALVPRVYHSFKVTEEANADFIEYVFATKLPDRELGKLISSGARMDGLLNISYDEFMSINMMLPSIEEQIKISEHLRKIDALITLHQRKCDNLKEMKKYMLQNMFPSK